MQKIMLNQPRGEERGQLTQLKKCSSKKSAWRCFSGRLGALLLHQAAPIFVLISPDFPAAVEIKQRPQIAAGMLRLALAAVEFSTDFSKSTRRLTKHISTEYPGFS